MSSTNAKRDLYVHAAVAKAIGNQHRLELLVLVAQGERSVEALTERSGFSIANASQHLEHLRRAGPVMVRRQAFAVLRKSAEMTIGRKTTLTFFAPLPVPCRALRRQRGQSLFSR